MKKLIFSGMTFVGVAAVVIALLCATLSYGQSKPGVRISIDDILHAHGVDQFWINTPQSIRLSGSSTHDGITEPVTITATSKEEALISYGSRKQVATSKSSFKDDGAKVTKQPTPSGFTQLDVTGVFLLTGMKGRLLSVGLGDSISSAGQKPLYRVHVLNNARSEFHYGHVKVNDEMDLFVNESGFLVGIERTFYAQLPVFKSTLGYSFSDFRNVEGVLLPYRIDKTLNGFTVETIRVTSYSFNVPTPSTLFEPRISR